MRAHLDAHPCNPTPHDSGDPIARFRERALSLASTVDVATHVAQVPACVARYLQERTLPLQAVCWPEFESLDWAALGVAVEARSARGDDLVGITGAYCAIAETGTLMMLSGEPTPPSVSLLPETHIAVVHRNRIVSKMEDAWAMLRAENRRIAARRQFHFGAVANGRYRADRHARRTRALSCPHRACGAHDELDGRVERRSVPPKPGA